MGQPEAGWTGGPGWVTTLRRTPRGPPSPRSEGPKGWPVLHYGPVPRFKPDTWDFTVNGARRTARSPPGTTPSSASCPRRGEDRLPLRHRFSMLDTIWSGVSATTVLDLVPPHVDATHVTVWAEYGYSANVRIETCAARGSCSPPQCGRTAHPGPRLPAPADRAAPVRLERPEVGPRDRVPRRGPSRLREERGYHNIGDPWGEQRFSYQEDTGDGPPSSALTC